MKTKEFKFNLHKYENKKKIIKSFSSCVNIEQLTTASYWMVRLIEKESDLKAKAILVDFFNELQTHNIERLIKLAEKKPAAPIHSK